MTVAISDPKAAGILVHDETNRIIARLDRHAVWRFPIALGVIYCDPAPTFDSAVMAQNR